MTKEKIRKEWLVALALSIAILVITIISLSLGSVFVPFDEVLRTLIGRGDEGYGLILLQLRLPRIVAGMLIGAAMAVSGALLQGVIRNPLAAPDLLGMTGGASVAVVAFVTFTAGAYSIHWIPMIAISGAFIATALNYILAWKKGISPFRLVMIGIGIATAMGALTTFFLISGPSFLAASVINWLTGSLYGSNWNYVMSIAPWVVVFLPLAYWYAKELNIQSLGEEVALGLGLRLQRSRFILIGISVLLAGAAVGVAGTIPFIGLLAPHMARKLMGNSYKILLPLSALLGAIIVMLADLAGRILFQPLDIPAGVFTAGVGAPFFLYLLYKRK